MIVDVVYLPAVWIAITALGILWGISFYLYMQLKRRTAEEFKKYNVKFVESGNAITDTLRVAFDNIKKNTRSANQLQSPLTELKARVHRIEQHISRIKVQGMPLSSAFPEEKEKSKITNQKNERRNK